MTRNLNSNLDNLNKKYDTLFHTQQIGKNKERFTKPGLVKEAKQCQLSRMRFREQMDTITLGDC